jgi:glutaredoxin-related protein
MKLRSTLYKAIRSTWGQGFAALDIPRSLAERLNHTLGKPLASEEELEERRQAKARLEAMRSGTCAVETQSRKPVEAPKAPVLVYFERDRGAAQLRRISELLASEGHVFQSLDVQDDEAMRSFVLKKSGIDLDKFPVVFVGEHSFGTYEGLVEAHVSGELKKKIANTELS